MCCSFHVGRARFRADDARASEKKTLVWPEEERGFTTDDDDGYFDVPTCPDR